MTTIARAYMKMPEHIKFEAKRQAQAIVKTIFQAAQPDWSLPVSIEQTKEEITRTKSKPKDAEKIDPKEVTTKNKKKKKKATKGKKAPENDIEDDNKDDQHIDLINDFKSEIEDIRKALEEDDKNDSKPKPEEW